MRTAHVKIAGVLWLWLCTLGGLIHKTRGVRATNDETLVASDLLTIMKTGSIETLGYKSGFAFQFLTTTLLRISGLNVEALQWLSPLIGLLVFGALFLLATNFASRYTSNWLSHVIIVSSFLLFPGFFNRIWETSHKKYTLLLSFLILYTAYMHIQRSDQDQRLLIVTVILFAGINSFNYIWSLVYGAVVGVVFLYSYSSRESIVMLIAGIAGLISPAVNNLTRYHQVYLQFVRQRISSLLTLFGIGQAPDSPNASTPNGSTPPNASAPNGSTPPNASGGDMAGSTAPTTPIPDGSSSTANIPDNPILAKLVRWGSSEIFGFNVQRWLIHFISIFVSALSAIIAGGFLLKQLINREQDEYDLFQLAVLTVTGGFFILFLVIGDEATLKRIVVFPGILSVWYVTLRVIPSISSHQWEQILRGAFAVLIVSSLLAATPRYLPDGGYEPTDSFVGPQESAAVEWIGAAESSCFRAQYGVRKLYLKRYGNQLAGPIESGGTIIYTSGERGQVGYDCD